MSFSARRRSACRAARRRVYFGMRRIIQHIFCLTALGAITALPWLIWWESGEWTAGLLGTAGLLCIGGYLFEHWGWKLG